MITPVLFTCRTDGAGNWSHKVADVPITMLELAYLNENNIFDSTDGELRVHFDTRAWNIHEDNIIYSDKLFLQQLQSRLQHRGFSIAATAAIGYSEAGMQGADYVSFDVGADFLRECDPFINFVTQQAKAVVIQIA